MTQKIAIQSQTIIFPRRGEKEPKWLCGVTNGLVDVRYEISVCLATKPFRGKHERWDTERSRVPAEKSSMKLPLQENRRFAREKSLANPSQIVICEWLARVENSSQIDTRKVKFLAISSQFCDERGVLANPLQSCEDRFPSQISYGDVFLANELWRRFPRKLASKQFPRKALATFC